MVSVNQNKITLTRGDSLRLQLAIYQSDGTAYTPASGDVITFAASVGYRDEDGYQSVISNKNIPTDTLLLSLSSSDTDIPSGTYNYDIQIANASNGTVDTFISSTLTITPQVV